MPAARLRRRNGRVAYVVVRREADGEDAANQDEPVPNPTATVHEILDRAHDRRQAFSLPSVSPKSSSQSSLPTLRPTVTFPPTLHEATRPAALQAENEAIETTAVAMMPPPRSADSGKGGISSTTQHLLIAAGSIGGTIIIVMIILGIHTMRKRGMSFSEALRAGRYQVTQGGPPPPPKQQTEYRDTKHENEYGSMRSQSVTPPQPAIARSGSFSSQKPLMALERSDSFNLNRQNSTRTASSPTQSKTFLLESPPPGRKPSHRRDESATPSSNALGPNPNTVRRSDSTRNTRSIGDEESELQYNDPPQERPLSPLPPPPTFKQFLTNRPSISGKQGGNIMSRFSWTNSNAPQTPRDTNSHAQAQGRDSYMTSRSSVPRFRTIDSWVNQQSNRIEAQKLKEQFRLTSTSTVYSEDSETREARDTVPEVPAMPKNVQALRESSAQLSSQLPNRRPATPPGPGLPGRNVKHQRHETSGTVDTAPIFHQHPGTEVRFSTKSAVPSEILDRGRNDNVLS